MRTTHPQSIEPIGWGWVVSVCAVFAS